MNIKPFKFSTDEDSKKVEYIYPTSKKIGITSLGITIEFLYYFDGKTNNNGYVYLEAKPYIEIASVKHRSFVEWLEICNDLGMILSIISGQVLAWRPLKHAREPNRTFGLLGCRVPLRRSVRSLCTP